MRQQRVSVVGTLDQVSALNRVKMNINKYGLPDL